MTKTRRFTRLLLPALALALALAPMILRFAGFSCYRVSSDSLSPALERDALAYVRRVDSSSLRAGEIVVFRLDAQQFAVSRVVRRSDETHFTVMDDCETSREFTVHEKNIVGKVVFSLPRLGALVSRESNRAVLLCALGAAYVLFCLACILRRGA